jgi:uncharacterized membrane protein
MVHLHLMSSHIPVIGILLLLPLLLIALLRRSDELSKIGLVGIVGIALASVAVYLTGEPTEEGVENLSGISRAMIERHESVALMSTVTLALFGLLALGALIRLRKKPVSRGIVIAALIGTSALTGAFAWTANLGGQIRHSEITTGSTGVAIPDTD